MGRKPLNPSVRVRLRDGELAVHNHFTKDEDRVLIIGDTHEPFSLDGYLEFCQEVYETYNLNRVVHIGDCIDNHYASYHETHSEALGGSDELELAIEKTKKWVNAFPEADVLLGNHDLIILRKAQTSSIPLAWIKDFKQVLDAPNWNFTEELIIDNVMYCHGVGSKAHVRCQKNMLSTVQGHHHTECYTHWYVGKRDKIFGMQVGCGIDIESYGMAYGKHFPKPAISVGVVLGGHTAFNVLMDL